MQDPTAEHILDRLSDLKNYPHEALAPYEEFKLAGKPTTSPPGDSSIARMPGRRR